MKITSFYPMIVTRDSEDIVKLFGEMGFGVRHDFSGTTETDYRIIIMEDGDGHRVDIAEAETESDRVIIRLNVDDFEETIEFLLAHGFRKPRHERASKTVDTGSSTYTMLVSPSGYIMAVSQHIKNRD